MREPIKSSDYSILVSRKVANSYICRAALKLPRAKRALFIALTDDCLIDFTVRSNKEAFIRSSIPAIMLRHSHLIARRSAVRRHASTTSKAAETASNTASKAKETASGATSKASEGLSKVTSSAGPALSNAAQGVGSYMGRIGGRTGKLIAYVECEWKNSACCNFEQSQSFKSMWTP